MARYRLIKNYPGACIPVGTVCDEDYYFNDFRVQISKYPEFWEKVEEKEYEILSLINSKKGGCNILTDKSNINSWSEGYGKNIWTIYSIKRLSDGEVFTVGDKVIDTKFAENRLIIIRQFANMSYYFIKHDFGFSYLSCVKKVKEPLFTSEDGVDVYYGDKYYVAYDNNYEQKEWRFKIYEADSADECSDLDLSDPYIHRFSTKEKAQEYVIMNRPCLSIKEIAPIIGRCNETTKIDLDKLMVKLKALVKNKIQ